jgi:protein-S-isoprenylcysteine O-methyltransferase Ste14
MDINWIDTIVGVLKFLVGLFWRHSSTPSEFFFPIACDFWMLLCLYWAISALRMKAVKARESLERRMSYVLPMIIGLALLFSQRAHSGWLGTRFAPESRELCLGGIVLTAAGVGLAMWARYILGENWSAAVSIRQDHELIRGGPYSVMRHPIYTGMLLGLLGTALVVGEIRGILALAIICAGFYRKARKEEAWLSREFGESFEIHAKRTGMFLPRFS